MKRNPKPFSVEIKKSRVQGQSNHLSPRRLFATAPAEATKTFLREEPQVVAEPSAAPRILPSIVEPMWSSSGPVEPVRCKRSSGETGRDQIEFDLAASASEDMDNTPKEAPVLGKTVSKTVIAAVVEEEVRPVYDVRPAEMTVASVVLSKVALRRMTKRLAAAAHLQRDERWKRRLHPAAW